MSTMTTEDQTYNGWKNYPTWNVNLWLGNDRELYDATLNTVALALDYADGHPNVPEIIWTQEQADLFAVADHLKRYVVEELAPDLGASFAADLLGYALDLVDWEEMAAGWIETFRDQVDS